MQHKKGNILIIVIFMMIISWLFWLLMTKFVANMINYSSLFHNYYQAYYIANAPLQLQVVKHLERDFWFDDFILSGSSTVINNLSCQNCYFSSELISRSNILINREDLSNYPGVCDLNENPYVLTYWEAVIIPLFWDYNSWEWKIYDENIIKLSDLSDISIQTDSVDNYIIWLIDINWNSTRTNNVNNLSSLSYNPMIKSYLIIANSTWWSTQRFCIRNSHDALPASFININSIWYYNWSYVWLSLRKNISLPEYLIYSIIN